DGGILGYASHRSSVLFPVADVVSQGVIEGRCHWAHPIRPCALVVDRGTSDLCPRMDSSISPCLVHCRAALRAGSHRFRRMARGNSVSVAVNKFLLAHDSQLHATG